MAGDTGAVLGDLAGRLGRVEEQLAEFHRRSAHRELVIDRLHEENQQLRGGFGQLILEPVVADLIRLDDQLTADPPAGAPGCTGIPETSSASRIFAYAVRPRTRIGDVAVGHALAWSVSMSSAMASASVSSSSWPTAIETAGPAPARNGPISLSSRSGMLWANALASSTMSGRERRLTSRLNCVTPS